MKILLLLFLALAVVLVSRQAFAGEVISPEEAQRRLATGNAVLIDVREPSEWKSGVVEGALLLSLSDLRADRTSWRPVLEAHRDKELILYCRSGNRSGQAVRLLANEGRTATNAGAYATWKKSGHPTRTP